MTHEWFLYASFFLALWSAVIGGVFSAFSEFIMAGLLRARPSAGIQAMQEINKTVIRTQFVAGILLIPVVSVVVAVYGANHLDGAARFALILAPAIYIPSVFLMTMIGNVPMNNRLASLDHESADAAAYWQVYGRRWTRLNHVRSLGSLSTALVYLVAGALLIASRQV
ncbi:DUF1772 domain-containing protein [Hyphobacterium sp.]|uniref:anthrone oxygenase family protein n=1 Tax=Hyphobacterium sp. TaxID=2004662 RepID=UPI003B5163BE